MGRVLAILYFPGEKDPNPRGLIRKFRNLERFKRAERDEAYMRIASAETFGDNCDFHRIEPHVDPSAWVDDADLKKYEQLVLLWSDAIGWGWSPIERAVLRTVDSATRVSVLSGRRRTFVASRGTLFAFRVRRVIERLWLGEIALGLGMLIVTPFILTWDLMRGRA